MTSERGTVRIYLAGKITGDNAYRSKFERASAGLRLLGYIVMSPAILPYGWEWGDYMHICRAMIDVCDMIAMLPDWKESRGAREEHAYAQARRMPTLYITEDGRAK